MVGRFAQYLGGEVLGSDKLDALPLARLFTLYKGCHLRVSLSEGSKSPVLYRVHRGTTETREMSTNESLGDVAVVP